MVNLKVQIFTGFTETGLSRKINKFIDNNSVEVVDIKFSTSFFYMGAIVIYRKMKSVQE